MCTAGNTKRCRRIKRGRGLGNFVVHIKSTTSTLTDEYVSVTLRKR